MSFRGTVDYTSVQGVQGEIHPSLIQAMRSVSMRPEGFGLETLPDSAIDMAQLNRALQSQTQPKATVVNNAILPNLHAKGPSVTR